MRAFVSIAIAVVIAFSSACGRVKPQAEQSADDYTEIEQAQDLPEGAIAFDYAWHLYFDVMLRDSIPARMIFDTGNTNILIDTEFFKKHFAPSPTLQRVVIQGAGNSLEGAYKDVCEWEYSIGDHKQTENGAVVMNLRKILGSGVDGMYGMEFMRGRKVEFNYADEYMRILSPNEQPAEGYVCVKCRWLDNREARMLLPISLKINDNLSFDGNFLLDMGSSGGLSLSSHWGARLKQVLTNVKKKVYDTGGVGGSRVDYIFKADKISIAGNDILDMRLDYSGNTRGMMAGDGYDGLVGNALLEHFDVIIDFEKCEIWLRPNRNFNATKPTDAGITLTQQPDCWIVNGLIEGGMPTRQALEEGMQSLLSMDLRPMS